MRSKKQSVAKSEPPEDLVFFIDESLGGHQVAVALRENGLTVEAHRDHFPPGCQDRVWLAHAGQRKWIVLTKDDRIRYRETEKAALLGAGVRAFVLTGGNLAGADIIAAFRLAMKKMLRIIKKERSAFVATVGRGGAVSVIVRGSASPEAPSV